MSATLAEIAELPRRRRRRVIGKYVELVAGPGEDYSIVLRFLYQIFEEGGGLTHRAELEWYAEHARREDLAPGVSQTLFEEFLDVLGLRPRRAVLLCMLGGLIEMGYVSQSIGGFGTTDKGLKLLESFSGARG